MAKKNVVKLRRRIAEARAELARTEGEQAGLSKQVDETVQRLREVLDCEPGEEKATMQALKDQIAADEAEIEEALDEVEALGAE